MSPRRRRSRATWRPRRRRRRPCRAGLGTWQGSGAAVFDLRLRVHLNGACMRCLGFAELEREVVAREFHNPDAPASDELRSDYVVSDHVRGSTWARDALALELPDHILCREDCAGLCPVCGKDLNIEPHEHLERDPDPRWAAPAAPRAPLRTPP